MPFDDLRVRSRGHQSPSPSSLNNPVFNTLQALPTTDPLHLLCPPPETFFSTYLPKSHGFVIHIIQISTQMLLSEKPSPTTLSERTSFSPFDHTLFLSLVFYFCSIYMIQSICFLGGD